MEDLIQISDEFEKLWNFQNWIDGNHVAIECPKLSATQYFNDKLMTKDFLVLFSLRFVMQNIALPMLTLVNIDAQMAAVS